MRGGQMHRNRWSRVRGYLKSSLWVVPLIAIPLGMITTRISEPPKGDAANVALWVKSGRRGPEWQCLLYPASATDRRQVAPQQAALFSIIQSARAGRVIGTMRPSTLAVLRLIASSHFIDPSGKPHLSREHSAN